MDPAFIHFALHADDAGLLLRWSPADRPEDMALLETLTWRAIEELSCWRERVIITGACGLLRYAETFLQAGAAAVLAPGHEITWDRLCHFFRLFYSHLLHGATLEEALERTWAHGGGYYDEFTAMGIAGNKSWHWPTHG